MNIRLYNTLSFFLVLIVAACGKIELPEGGGTAGKGQETVSPDLPHVTVAIAQQMPSGTRVVVTGYVVGYTTGSSLSAAVFDFAADKENTNVLLADDAAETNVAYVIPVQLEKNTAVRAALNLFEHPENLRRRVSIEGTLEDFFSVQGLKKVKGYVWESDVLEPGNDDDNSDNPDDGGDDGNEDNGTDPNEDIALPQISDEEKFVKEGR